MLWEALQKLYHEPRSRLLNHWDSATPEGTAPMDWNQPCSPHSRKKRA